MKKTISAILTAIIFSGIFSFNAFAADGITPISITPDRKMEVRMWNQQKNNTLAVGIRSSYCNSEGTDIIQYLVKDETVNSDGLHSNPAFDFYPVKVLVNKEAPFDKARTIYGGDSRAPIELYEFGWIGAGHGTPCAVSVTSKAHGLGYDKIGLVYTDSSNIKWTLLRIPNADTLIFVSQLKPGRTKTNPSFYSSISGNLTLSGLTVTVNSQKGGVMLNPSYSMDRQQVMAVNGGTETEVTEFDKPYICDKVAVYESYRIKNPATVADTITKNRPENGYTENPDLAVGEDLVEFNLTYTYFPDGTTTHSFSNKLLANVNVSRYGGIQYGKKEESGTDTYIYLPKTKEFEGTGYTSDMKDGGTAVFNYSFPRNSSDLYPGNNMPSAGFDSDNPPDRRLDILKNTSSGKVSALFAGGYLPVAGSSPEIRKNNINTPFFMWNTRKAYFHLIDSTVNSKTADKTGYEFSGMAYKKWVKDADPDMNYSYYTVPYEDGSDKYVNLYIDIYAKEFEKIFDLSQFCDTYSITVPDTSSSLSSAFNGDSGLLTVKSGTDASSDFIVINMKYIGINPRTVERMINRLNDVYSTDMDSSLSEIEKTMKENNISLSSLSQTYANKLSDILSQKMSFEAEADKVRLTGKVSVSEENGKVTLTADLETSKKFKGKKCTLILAFYNAEGKLILLEKKDVSSPDSQTFTEKIENIQKPYTTAKVKGFIWSGLNSLKPLDSNG